MLPTHLPPPSCTHAQSCDPMDCSPPGSSVHGLFQARILEWVAISFSLENIFNLDSLKLILDFWESVFQREFGWRSHYGKEEKQNPRCLAGSKQILGLRWWLSGKESACQCKRPGFDPWVRKIFWRRKWQPTPVPLPGKSHGQSRLVGYSPWVAEESDMTYWLNSNKVDS